MRKLILPLVICLGLALSAFAVEPQIADLKVFHRVGQTFITFKEIDPPQITADIDDATVRKTVRDLDEKKLHYRIYRSRECIDSVEDSALLAQF